MSLNETQMTMQRVLYCYFFSMAIYSTLAFLSSNNSHNNKALTNVNAVDEINLQEHRKCDQLLLMWFLFLRLKVSVSKMVGLSNAFIRQYVVKTCSRLRLCGNCFDSKWKQFFKASHRQSYIVCYDMLWYHWGWNGNVDGVGLIKEHITLSSYYTVILVFTHRRSLSIS